MGERVGCHPPCYERPAVEAGSGVYVRGLVRAGRPGDAEAVAQVHVRAWQSAYARVFPRERLADLNVERRVRRWRDWPPLVAEADGTIVGFVSVGASREPDADGELFAIYVDPDHWGTGVGRDLITAAEERLRELGYSEAMLWVLAENARARRFYERAGWHHDGTTRPIEIFGIEVTEVRYRKDLTRGGSPAEAK
jgi:GNAT superfamily N-acetyltransferase